MKKKISFAFIMAIVLLILLAAAAVAEVLGFNVFELFGKTDTRYAELAPYTVLESTPEVSVNSEELGRTDAGINSAYYDGNSLIVGYAIRNGSHMEECIPDETLTAEMVPVDNNLVWAANNEKESELIAVWMQARDAGRKAGLVRYNIFPGDHTETDDGTDIGPAAEESREGEDGFMYTMRDYGQPLAEELRNLDQLSVNIRLYRGAEYLYFDGEKTWTLQKTEPAGVMRAVVQKIGAETPTYKGTGSFKGMDVSVSAIASASHAALDIHFSAPLPQLPEGSWYSYWLTDETGTALCDNEVREDGTNVVAATFEGTGTVPQELRLRITEEKEGSDGTHEVVNGSDTIILSIQK